MESSQAVVLVLFGVLICVQGVVAIGLVGEFTDLRRSALGVPTPLPTGLPAPALALVMSPAAPEALRLRKHVVLFLSARCAPCFTLAGEIARMKVGGPDRSWAMTVVCGGDGDECAALAVKESERLSVATDADGALMAAYKVGTAPAAVVVVDGKIAVYGYPRSARDIEELVASAAAA
jgi:hypothetical protein